MLQTDKYSVINIRKMMEDAEPELGERNLIELLSEFSCDKNKDVELLGYFTVAMKPISVRGETISNTVKRKLLRISEMDENTKTYTMAAYLIGQIGKNYDHGLNKRITGDEMLELVCMIVEKIQYMCGGVVAFLEAEEKEKLLDFYQKNRFQKFDTRQTSSTTEEPHELIQLLRLL